MHPLSNAPYVDVHTHLTHHKFSEDLKQVVARAEDADLGAIVVNGLEPKSNRQILQLSKEFQVIKPALGIYPVDAVNSLLPDDFPIEVKKFCVSEELKFIRQEAMSGRIHAIGECGLDGYWLEPKFDKLQEEVFEALIEISMESNIPIIVHTRKKEKRCMEILAHHGAQKVNFHCFCGKVKVAVQSTEVYKWNFSIPAQGERNEGFRKMLASLPLDRILTETDAPYLSPTKGERNEPANVVGTVKLLSELRGLTLEEGRQTVWQNYRKLFC